MRISDWSSDVCSSDLAFRIVVALPQQVDDVPVFVACRQRLRSHRIHVAVQVLQAVLVIVVVRAILALDACQLPERRHRVRFGSHGVEIEPGRRIRGDEAVRSEEHTSELQSLMRISYAVFCLKKKNQNKTNNMTIKQD